VKSLRTGVTMRLKESMSQRRTAPSRLSASTLLALGGMAVAGCGALWLLAAGPLSFAVAPVPVETPVETPVQVAALEEEPTEAVEPERTAERLDATEAPADEPRETTSRLFEAAAQAPAAPLPSASDPRWDSAASAGGFIEGPLEQGSAMEGAESAALLPQPDAQQTSSIVRDAPALPIEVAVAETEAEIAALEAIQQQENAAVITDMREEEGSTSATIEASMRTASVSTFVNLRDAPSNDSNVLAVVPANAEVRASQECPLQWCEVVHEGTRGYVFEGFVR
jgi:hypothetical protein